jgi:two-component system, NtrC family, sensor histidine kinase HydH
MENDPVRAQRNDQWKIIEKISSMMADDIKNPLNAIKLNTDILLESDRIPDEEKEHLHVIVKEVRRLNRLVKDVLALSRDYKLIFTDSELRTIVNQAFTRLHQEMEDHNIVAVVDLPAVRIRIDAERMIEVIVHLVSNAIEAIGAGGMVKICTATPSREGTFSFFVINDGPGVENEDRVFEPFFTTKRTKNGLGLSISQRIIEQHGGTLELVSSRPGETVFAITLREGVST